MIFGLIVSTLFTPSISNHPTKKYHLYQNQKWAVLGRLFIRGGGGVTELKGMCHCHWSFPHLKRKIK